MAIMRRCCCFDNTRAGSTASGVFSLIYSVIILGWWVYQYTVIAAAAVWSPFFNYDPIYAAYFLNFICLVFLFVSSIILLVGVSKDNKVFLLPYIVAICVLLFFQLIGWIIWLAILGLFAILLIVDFIFWLIFTALNVVCLLCVISQYQELKEGRGRIADVNAARTNVVVIHQQGVVTTTHTGGATVVTSSGQGYPPAQQGYPPPQQGYPPPQQGYPPAQQGYPPPQQGYPPVEQPPNQPGQADPPGYSQGAPPQEDPSYPTK